MADEYKLNDNFKIINGSNLDVLPTIADNSIDAIVTDPPYEIGFMSRKWDNTGIAYNIELWKQALRVLKPGGYLLAFGGTRTYHRITVAIEDAGFEIRDCIMWLYGCGFPKSHNIGLAVDELRGVESKVVGKMDAPDLHDVGVKQKALGNGHVQSFGQIENAERMQYEIKEAQNEWNGWGTALKPAYEPVVVARKPIEEKTVAENCLKYGTGGINIDECRVGSGGGYQKVDIIPNSASKNCGFGCDGKVIPIDKGRFPANVITDGSDEVAAGMPNTKSSKTANDDRENKNNSMFIDGVHNMSNSYDDEGSAMRYFYQAKASKKDRDAGLEKFETMQATDGCIRSNADTARMFGANSILKKNIHPTVKPVELMQYLVRLVTAKGGTVLDIFNGSGSTGKAVAFENRERNAGYKYIGIELEKQYCEISLSRIDYALNKFVYDELKYIEEEKKRKQENGEVDLFDFAEGY